MLVQFPIQAKTLYFATPSSVFDLKEAHPFSMGPAVYAERFLAAHPGNHWTKRLSRQFFCRISKTEASFTMRRGGVILTWSQCSVLNCSYWKTNYLAQHSDICHCPAQWRCHRKKRIMVTNWRWRSRVQNTACRQFLFSKNSLCVHPAVNEHPTHFKARKSECCKKEECRPTLVSPLKLALQQPLPHTAIGMGTTYICLLHFIIAAIYLAKRTLQGKASLELDDYEADSFAGLQKMFQKKWAWIMMQADSSVK